MEKTVKKYEELTIVDDFMFGKVMRDPERCRRLLEIVLEKKIRKVVLVDDQKMLNPDYLAKGIRMDVYVEDEEDTVYDVEMQTGNRDSLPKRSRYYQAVIDINLLEKGEDYEKLQKSYIIFICTFDLFGAGRHVYHFENLCREDASIRLTDEAEKIFLNTKGTMEDVDGELKSLLDYLETLVPQDDFTQEIDDAVSRAKEHREWRNEYMLLEVMMWDAKAEGRAEGRTEGKAEGRVLTLIELVCRKLTKGKTAEVIAQELEEDPAEIQKICEAAAKYAPDYDREKILGEIKEIQ